MIQFTKIPQILYSIYKNPTVIYVVIGLAVYWYVYDAGKSAAIQDAERQNNTVAITALHNYIKAVDEARNASREVTREREEYLYNQIEVQNDIIEEIRQDTAECNGNQLPDYFVEWLLNNAKDNNSK